MTRHLLIVGAALAALSLAACGPKADETGGAATPSEQAATPDANPAATVPTVADETKADVFAMKAADLNMFEIETAKLAATRSTNAQVKAFASKMATAHGKTSDSLQAAIAVSGAATLPMALSKDLQDDLDDLSKAGNDDFDKTYADAQVDAHQAMLNLLQRYAQDGDSPAIRAFAAATAPTVQEHLNMAEGLKKGFVN